MTKTYYDYMLGVSK